MCRPHQSLDMACPASKFVPRPAANDDVGLWALADLEPSSTPSVQVMRPIRAQSL